MQKGGPKWSRPNELLCVERRDLLADLAQSQQWDAHTE